MHTNKYTLAHALGQVTRTDKSTWRYRHAHKYQYMAVHTDTSTWWHEQVHGSTCTQVHVHGITSITTALLVWCMIQVHVHGITCTNTNTWYYMHKYKYRVLYAQIQGQVVQINMQKYKCMTVQAHIQVQVHGSTGTYTSTWYYMHKIQIHGNTYTKYRYVSMMHHLGIYTQEHGSSCIDTSTCQYMHRHKYIKVWTWSNKKLLRKYNKQLRFAPVTINSGQGHRLSLAGAATSNIFVATKVLSQQTRVCHNIFCHDKSMLAVTKLLS